MGKRFTESDKWMDPWFRALRAEFKLAWLYLLDNCDNAGVIDIDRKLAEFQIGNALDWDEFETNCSDRIEKLPNGKWWVVRFIEFQYGALSRDCRPHNPIFLSLARNGIDPERVSKGFQKVFERAQDKDKEKDKDQDKEKEKEKDKEKERWLVPDRLDSERIRKMLSEFAEMRRAIRKPIKDFASSSRLLEKFDDEDHLAYALETCIGNQYQGLKPEYRPEKRINGNGARSPTFAQQRLENTKRAMMEFANDGKR